jgi:hypothetical protein
MAKTSISVQETLALLAEGPKRIAALTAGLTAAQLRTRPEPDEWSENEILAHLRSCADVWGSCIRTILAQESPTLKAINPTTWINQTDYPQQDFSLSLQSFTTQRADLLVLLESLTPEEWARSVLVTGAGKPLERTVFFYAQWLARHERTHYKQIEKTAKTMRA